mgnify:CR=1 FL=1
MSSDSFTYNSKTPNGGVTISKVSVKISVAAIRTVNPTAVPACRIYSFSDFMGTS